MAKRNPKPSLEQQERRRYILETAAKVFHDRGYDNTAISDVADAVRLTKAGLYHYIRSKEQLLFEIMDYGMDLTEEAVVVPITTIKDPLEKLKKLIENHMKLILLGRKREITVILHENKTLKGAFRSRINERKNKYIHMVEEILSAVAKKYGTYRVDITSSTFCLLGMINWSYQWYRPMGRLSHEQLIRDFTTIFLHGFLGKEVA